MTEKKKSSSSEDETLMMTDDLLGRLEPESLIEQPEKVDQPFYNEEEETKVTPSLPIILAFFSHNNPASPIVADGTLQSLSFGEEGWRVVIGAVEPSIALSLAVRAAADVLTSVKVFEVAELTGNIDVTVHFGDLDGKCSVTVAADNGASI